jgi:hypothetical protein
MIQRVRDCSETCQAGILQHAFRRVHGELESVSVTLGGYRLARPDVDLQWLDQWICNIMEGVETDIRESREARDRPEMLFIETGYHDIDENENAEKEYEAVNGFDKKGNTEKKNEADDGFHGDRSGHYAA